MKTFYSAQEIEDLARQGVRELLVDDRVVLTDLARQMAGQLGLRLVTAPPTGVQAVAQVPGPASTHPAPNGTAYSVPAPAAMPLPAKPKGCQHGATVAVANGQAAIAAPAPNRSAGGRMVDDLVGLVKQMSKR